MFAKPGGFVGKDPNEDPDRWTCMSTCLVVVDKLQPPQHFSGPSLFPHLRQQRGPSPDPSLACRTPCRSRLLRDGMHTCLLGCLVYTVARTTPMFTPRWNGHTFLLQSATLRRSCRGHLSPTSSPWRLSHVHYARNTDNAFVVFNDPFFS